MLPKRKNKPSKDKKIEIITPKPEFVMPKGNWPRAIIAYLVDIYCLYIFLVLVNVFK